MNSDVILGYVTIIHLIAMLFKMMYYDKAATLEREGKSQDMVLALKYIRVERVLIVTGIFFSVKILMDNYIFAALLVGCYVLMYMFSNYKRTVLYKQVKMLLEEKAHAEAMIAEHDE